MRWNPEDHVSQETKAAIKQAGEEIAAAAKCHCAEPHYTPMWWCPVHGEVVVPMD